MTREQLAELKSLGAQYRAKSYIGAPRPTKMGTIASLWRYDFTCDLTPVYPMPC
jgi:hypothetical protein